MRVRYLYTNFERQEVGREWLGVWDMCGDVVDFHWCKAYSNPSSSWYLVLSLIVKDRFKILRCKSNVTKQTPHLLIHRDLSLWKGNEDITTFNIENKFNKDWVPLLIWPIQVEVAYQLHVPLGHSPYENLLRYKVNDFNTTHWKIYPTISHHTPVWIPRKYRAILGSKTFLIV